MRYHAGGPVIDRYTKVTTDTEQEIREAVAVFDTIRASKAGFTDNQITGYQKGDLNSCDTFAVEEI